MSEHINALVESRDAGALRDLLLSQDIEQMLDTYHYLTLLPSEWLSEVVRTPLIQDVWFAVFARHNPGELVAAYEYDYFSRVASDTTQTECHQVIDFLLGVHFACRDGPQPGVHGKQFFARSARHDTGTLASHWFDSAQGVTAIDTLALQPPQERAAEWTVFHVTLRRIAFWIIRAVAAHCGDVALRPLIRYAAALRTKDWVEPGHSADMIRDFFSPPDNPLLVSSYIEDEEEWRAIVSDAVERVQNEMASLEPGATLLSCFATEEWPLSPSLGFIYESTTEMQAAFLTILSRPQ